MSGRICSQQRFIERKYIPSSWEVAFFFPPGIRRDSVIRWTAQRAHCFIIWMSYWSHTLVANNILIPNEIGLLSGVLFIRHFILLTYIHSHTTYIHTCVYKHTHTHIHIHIYVCGMKSKEMRWWWKSSQTQHVDFAWVINSRSGGYHTAAQFYSGGNAEKQLNYNNISMWIYIFIYSSLFA